MLTRFSLQASPGKKSHLRDSVLVICSIYTR